MKINIFGDFKAAVVSGLIFSPEIQGMIDGADINLVNFEAPVKSNGQPIKKSGPNISQDEQAPAWLEEKGFNAVSLANNHTMDYGKVGLTATKEQFKKATVIGAGTWKEAYKMQILNTKEGLRVGILCCTHCEFGTLIEPEGIGCAWAMSPEICRLIKEGREKIDFLIVMPHGGVEYTDQPLPEWREVYKLWIDLGADAVIASHPHVPQGWEMYEDKPICYSLGNFCFSKLSGKKPAPEHWYESLCCELNVTNPHTATMEIKPLVYNQRKQYISENESEEFAAHMKDLNETLQDETKYMTYVNSYCKKLLPFYMGQFSRGGMVVNLFSKGYLKGLAEGFLGRGFFSKEHALNNIRCESHRWAIMRGLKV